MIFYILIGLFFGINMGIDFYNYAKEDKKIIRQIRAIIHNYDTHNCILASNTLERYLEFIKITNQ